MSRPSSPDRVRGDAQAASSPQQAYAGASLSSDPVGQAPQVPPPPAPLGYQLLDSRGITKPKDFSGRREDFEEWVFPFESYTAMLG